MNIIILCGGKGTRLWPISREKFPKQFHSLVNENSMFQNTLLRFLNNDKININKFIIICNKDHEFIVNEQLEQLNMDKQYIIVSEPIGRDSAPAVCIGTLLGNIDSTSLIVPCDHVFDDLELCTILNDAKKIYIDNSIITIGIKPTYPETGYGYIQTNEKYETVIFKEKPDFDTANIYIETGLYLWNAGLFMFENKTMLKCFETYSNEILEHCKCTLENSNTINNNISLNKKLFEKCPSISIDYAIMEPLTKNKCKNINAYTVPYSGKWSDVGSFKVLYDINNKDENKNIINGNIITESTKNCLIQTDNSLVATIGIENLIIVNQRDALLIAHQDHSQDVKKILNKIENPDLKIVHSKAFRPWGWYINVEGNDHSGYKVKRIGVYPGKRLSLQSHNHRSEHWVITKGMARVQLNDDFVEMGPNEHIFIPVKSLHRMENIGEEIVEFIETQIGDYLGEDDIVRYEDDFGRA